MCFEVISLSFSVQGAAGRSYSYNKERQREGTCTSLALPATSESVQPCCVDDLSILISSDNSL